MSQEKSTILKGNLEIALRMAIECREKEERAMNFTGNSAMLGGWRENLEALKKGNLGIKYPTP
jgi:hypothetical protein